tara:strand:- start:1506 stop:1880 length:375 start_codon:yes stop_codon:yes gene_type:complete
MNTKFENMKSQELLQYVFGEYTPDRFVPFIESSKNDLGRTSGFIDTATNSKVYRRNLIDKAIEIRMLEICEIEKEMLESQIKTADPNDIDKLTRQLDQLDHLIDEVNENALRIIGEYEKRNKVI